MVSIDQIKTVLESSLHLTVTLKRPHRMFVSVPRDQLHAAAGLLAQNGVQHLSTITGRDTGSGFEVLYHFFIDDTVLTFKVMLPRDDPVVDSIIDLFPSSVLYERELLDLLGITPRGHPDLRRLVLPDDWPGGYPLRKDWKPSQEEPHA
jgi:membrane-bound hydrogenase subunit beta